MLADPPDLAAVLTLADFEPLARERMAADAYDYVAGGTWDEITLAESREAWLRYRFVPRVLRDVRTVDLSGSFLGRRSPLPVAVAPMAAQSLAHPDAEVAMARGAAAAGIPFCMSTSSSLTMEEVAGANPDAERWFQLYLAGSMDASRALVERAAASGYAALVVTVDLPVLGHRIRDKRSGFALPFLPHLDPVRDAGMAYGGLEKQRALGLTWADVETFRSWSDLPLVLKGVLSTDDARRAVECGVDAIVVSNHGGRQLDRAIPSAVALPGIVDAVGDDIEVWVDGGIRSALDVAVALALGARGVLLGRPLYWALATAGSAGVVRALELLAGELEITLALLGCASIADVTPDLLMHRGRIDG